MDNDNILLQKARNVYKGAVFKWKYRGVAIFSAEEGNNAIAAALRGDSPFAAGRCGATEMRCTAEYLQNHGKNYGEKIREEIRNLSGVFPTDTDTLNRFAAFYTECTRKTDLLALWDVGAEREVIRSCQNTKFTMLRALEPYYHPQPWSAALKGQRVLVVHPFKSTIERQYERRELLFPHTEILPEFADLTVIPAVQGLAGQETGFATWFDALESMCAAMDAARYDVAIIGAGAYSLPLAVHAKQMGHKAVQMSGATQLLFGIKGRRWDTHPIISKLYNENWVRPAPAEGLTHKEKVEGGSYW